MRRAPAPPSAVLLRTPRGRTRRMPLGTTLRHSNTASGPGRDRIPPDTVCRHTMTCRLRLTEARDTGRSGKCTRRCCSRRRRRRPASAGTWARPRGCRA